MLRRALAPIRRGGRYEGSAAKGLFVLNRALPPDKKVLLVGRHEQRKVDARPGCAAATHGVSSLEVLRTYERSERVRLDVYLIPLLEVAAGERKAELHELLRELQRKEARKFLTVSDKGLSRLERREQARRVIEERSRGGRGGAIHKGVSLAELDRAEFDVLTEPYMQLELARLMKDALSTLKAGARACVWRDGWPGAVLTRSRSLVCAGKLTVPDSASFVIVPDVTGSLQPGEVCPVMAGNQMPRPTELASDDPFHVLLYGAPGMHPGDLHKVKVAYPELLLRSIDGAATERKNGALLAKVNLGCLRCRQLGRCR